MSIENHITIRISVPLILAQVVRSRAELQDARSYLQRLLSGPCFTTCSSCSARNCFILPVNDHELEEYGEDTDKWTVLYDPDTTPTAAEVASLDQNAEECDVSLRGITLLSPVYKINQTYQDEEHVHRLSMADEIAAVFSRLQQFQLKANSLIYASSESRMNITIDHENNDFPPETFSRVDRLLECCARQYDFLTGCADSGSVFDLFAFLSPQPAEQVEEVEERHAFDTAIDFAQAPSTLDSARIVAWVDILVKTVARCGAAEETFLDWTLSSQGDHGAPSFTSTGLLCSLDVEPSTLEFYFAKGSALDAGILAKAMNAVISRDPLGSLALYVANSEASRLNKQNVSDRIKLKLLTGGYGLYPREYSRKALIAIGEEAANGGNEEEEAREGVDFVFKTDPGRMSILEKKAKRATCIW